MPFSCEALLQRAIIRHLLSPVMSQYLEIQGGKPLNGAVQVSGAKNAALPMLMASLLTSEPVTYERVPNLEDVSITLRILEHFGAQVSYGGSSVTVQVPELTSTQASYSLVKALRASFWVLGPLLARAGTAEVALPGGDAIGARPVDIHLQGLTRMGADIKLRHGVVHATRNGAPLRPIDFDLGFASVGATHQLMMAASLIPGTTVLRNVAREPEVVALAELLTAMGAQVEGAGENVITVRGRSELGGAKITLIGDRVEAATYLVAGAASGGAVEVRGITPGYLGNFLDVLSSTGLAVSATADSVSVKYTGRLRAIEASTAPFPGLATDFQAVLMALLCRAEGRSVIEENIFEGRFTHTPELMRMGAKIEVQDRLAHITGVPTLSGAPVESHDIRCGAALVVAALSADGVSQVHEIHHLRRGYEQLETKLTALGASIRCCSGEAEESEWIGC